MAQRLDYLKQTASQTAGPYVHIGLAPHEAGFDIFETSFGHVLTGPDTRGERIAIEGTVIDGGGAVVKDALVEIWQANAFGRYNHPADRQDRNLDPDFRGWGRAAADFDTGLWRFETVKPGACMGRNGRMMAPHVSLWIVARGINIGLHTRMYFADEAQANAADPVLGLIENPQRRTTLIAPRLQRGAETVYRFDIVLQGENETVFLDV
jgi:protocatechuate 3,4-dioxygenase alpha subunit